MRLRGKESSCRDSKLSAGLTLRLTYTIAHAGRPNGDRRAGLRGCLLPIATEGTPQGHPKTSYQLSGNNNLRIH